jgi:hypothetical protein
VTIVTEHMGDRDEDTVTIVGGKTVTRTVSIGGVPPTSLVPGKSAIDLQIFGRMVADGKITKAVDEFFFNGTSLGSNIGDPDLLNDDFDHEIYFGAAAFQLQYQFRRDVEYGNNGRWLPYLNASLGYASLELEFHNNEFPDDSNTYKDEDIMYGLGTGLVFDCKSGGFIGGDVFYQWTSVDADRDPPVATPGGTLLQDSAKLDYDSLSLRLYTGKRFLDGRAYYWLGALGNQTNVNVDGLVQATFPTGDIEIRFENDIEDESVQLEAGLQFQFGQSPFTGGCGAATDGDNWNVGVNFGYSF